VKLNRKNWIWLLAILLFTSCQAGVVSPHGFAKFMKRQDNGLHKSIEIGDFRYEIDYLPAEWQALREIEADISQEKFENALGDFTEHEYFLLTIKMNGIKRIGDFIKNNLSDEEMNVIRFSLATKFKLLIGEKEYPCKLYHLEEMALAGTGLRFFMVYDTKGVVRGERNYVFSFQDDFLGKQKLKLTFKKEDLQNIPSLKL